MEALDLVINAEEEARGIRQKALSDARARLDAEKEAGERLLFDAAAIASVENEKLENETKKEIAHLQTESVGEAETRALALRAQAKKKREGAISEMMSFLKNQLEQTR